MSLSIQTKGIILAGGTGSRLYPLTKVVSKQLMAVYDKPMIYYPLSTLMQANIRDILIITTPYDLNQFKYLLGDGSQWGIKLNYSIQDKPSGIAQAFLIAEDFLAGNQCALILGDNLFHGDELIPLLKIGNSEEFISTIFAYPVSDPERYGVVEFSEKGKILSIEEKPTCPKSNYAITGLYFFDQTVVERAKQLTPSARGELEITDINKMYLKDGKLNVKTMGRGMAWLDTGNFDSLHEAGSFIKALEHRQGLKVGCPEEIAWRFKWINNNELKELAKPLMKSGYGNYLLGLISQSQLIKP